MKATELKAIAWYANSNNLKPQISLPPTQMFFTDRETGLDKVIHLDSIILQYNAWNKEDKKQRAKARKLEKDGVKIL